MSCVLIGNISVAGNEAKSIEKKPETVRDHLWVWAHYPGSFNKAWGLPTTESVEPEKGAEYLGIPNIIFIRYNGKPARPFDDYAMTHFKDTKQVSWSVSETGIGELTSGNIRDEVFAMAEKMPNITSVFMDDFFHILPDTKELPTQKKEWLGPFWPGVWPITYTIDTREAIKADAIEITQVSLDNFRTKEFTADISNDGKTWVKAIASGIVPNEPKGKIMVKFPESKFRYIRINAHSTHDTDTKKQSMSCGYSRIRLFSNGKEIPTSDFGSSASGCFGYGYDVQNALLDGYNLATITLGDLKEMRKKLSNVGGRKLDLAVVLYSHQLYPETKPYLEQCDIISLWTWTARDLKNLEENMAKLEKLAPGKRIWLGLYMWDFGALKPMPLDAMKKQTELAHKWLKEGRIDGMIFLGTNICEMNLDTVKWSKDWIEKHGDQVLDSKVKK